MNLLLNKDFVNQYAHNINIYISTDRNVQLLSYQRFKNCYNLELRGEEGKRRELKQTFPHLPYVLQK